MAIQRSAVNFSKYLATLLMETPAKIFCERYASKRRRKYYMMEIGVIAHEKGKIMGTLLSPCNRFIWM